MMTEMQKELISSRSNKTVKHLKTLSLPRNRQREGHFLLEGVRIIEEVMELDCCMEKLIVTPAAAADDRVALLVGMAMERGIDVMLVADRVIEYLSETKTSQGVMALVKPVEFGEEDLEKGQLQIILVAHLLQDPGNLGTMIRVAEAAGIGGVVTTPGTVDFYNPKALRATMGSIFRLPAVRVESLEGFITRCKNKGYQVVAAMVSAKTRYYELDYGKPTVLLVGQEAAGLPAEAYGLTDYQVSIPMATMIDSLNVASAAGIILYEAVRQNLAR
jgi:TrmH family RNA methyltransferase